MKKINKTAARQTAINFGKLIAGGILGGAGALTVAYGIRTFGITPNQLIAGAMVGLLAFMVYMAIQIEYERNLSLLRIAERDREFKIEMEKIEEERLADRARFEQMIKGK